jgi:hypothetical protein
VQRPPMASALATALLSLERASATGVLLVHGEGEVARLAIVDGIPRALTGVRLPGDGLGERLARNGDLDRNRCDDVARRSGRGLPVGWLLIEAGAARPEAVAWALRVQLRERMRVLLARERASLRFENGVASVGAPHVVDAVCAADLVLDAMRRTLADAPVEEAWRALRTEAWALTPLGEALLARATLWPVELALVAGLRTGTAMDALAVAAADRSRAAVLFRALRALRAVGRRGEEATSCALLLRKSLELRQQRDARTLLELEAGGDRSAARRSFRRLVGVLHPDRLGPSAPDALRRATTDVVVALQSAVAQVV